MMADRLSLLAGLTLLLGACGDDQAKEAAVPWLPPYKHESRRLSDDVLRLEAGRCLDARKVPAPWRRLPDDPRFDPPNAFDIATPLRALGITRAAYTDAEDRPVAPLTEVTGYLAAWVPDDPYATWPVAEPGRVQAIISEGMYVRVPDPNSDFQRAGLELYRRRHNGPVDDMDWMITSPDRHTQCDFSFGMVSLVHFAKCRIIDNERYVVAGFDLPKGARDQLPTVIRSLREVVEATTTECPQAAQGST